MNINYGEKEIEFQVKYKERKSIRVSVKPDLEVEILAPLGTKDEKIKEIVLKRASWILKEQEYFKKFLPRLTPRYYVSGETHRYLGRQYRLKVIAADKNNVKLKGKFIYINTINKLNREYNKELLYEWYKEHAIKKFNELFETCYEKVRKYDIEKPTWSIRKMKLRWGSYDPKKNNINLNIELIKASIYGIEYVIMHELCHIKHLNHNKEFYKFLSLVMPEWKDRKEKLENTII